GRESHRHWSVRSDRRLDDVLAGHEAKNSELADVVADGRASRVHELSLSVGELITHRVHLRVGDRIAELVTDAARNHASSGQAEIDRVEHLAIRRVERLAGFE